MSGEDPDDDLRVGGPGPDEAAELADLVSGCLTTLSVRDATAVALVTNLGFSMADLAAALGITPGAAKVVVHRGRRRLRYALTLELMVRRKGAGCAEFAALHDSGDLRGAAHHVRSCPACAAQAQSDVSLYNQRFAPAPTV